MGASVHPYGELKIVHTSTAAASYGPGFSQTLPGSAKCSGRDADLSDSLRHGQANGKSAISFYLYADCQTRQKLKVI